MSDQTINYEHDPIEQQIVARNEAGQVVGEIDYEINDASWTIIHTGVRRAYRGGDIARTLVRLAVEAAREAGVALDATCSYAVKVLQRTSEYHDIFTPKPDPES